MSLNKILLVGLLTFLMGCAGSKEVAPVPTPQLLDENTFKITRVSTDKSYGYSELNPIKVGNGPKNARRYLNALAGPKGQKITYARIGSCCTFKTPYGYQGIGQLDRYKVSWAGLASPMILYIDMFDSGEMKSPPGLTIAPFRNSTAPSTKRSTRKN